MDYIAQSATTQESRIPGWSDSALNLLRKHCGYRKSTTAAARGRPIRKWVAA